MSKSRTDQNKYGQSTSHQIDVNHVPMWLWIVEMYPLKFWMLTWSIHSLSFKTISKFHTVIIFSTDSSLWI